MNPFKNAKIIGSGIDPEVYIRQTAHRGEPDYVMSRSDLMEFLKCPHKWFMGGKASDDTKSTQFGSLMDTLVLEPAKLDARYAVAPAVYPCEPTKKDERTEKPWNRNATYCSEWEEAQEKAGKTALKASEMQEAQTAFEALAKDKLITSLVVCSTTQVYVIGEYHDPETGIVIPVKGLIDMVPDIESPFRNALADFKTTASADPRGFGRAVNDYGYDTQASLYLDLYNAATNEGRQEWLLAIQENEPPYETGRRILSAEFIQLGREKYITALRLYASCAASGVWPGYDTSGRDIIDGWRLCSPDAYMASRAMDSWPELPEMPKIEPLSTRLARIGGNEDDFTP